MFIELYSNLINNTIYIITKLYINKNVIIYFPIVSLLNLNIPSDQNFEKKLNIKLRILSHKKVI